jgi:hypothetical protein
VTVGRAVDASQLSNRLLALYRIERDLIAICRILGGLLGGTSAPKTSSRFGLFRRVERKSWKVDIFLSVLVRAGYRRIEPAARTGLERGARTEDTGGTEAFLGGVPCFLNRVTGRADSQGVEEACTRFAKLFNPPCPPCEIFLQLDLRRWQLVGQHDFDSESADELLRLIR